MITEVKLPQLSMGVVECQVSRWLVAVGETVQQGQLLVEIDTDKTIAELEAPESGVLVEIRHPAGASVAVGQTLALIRTHA
jgi:pyruvate/2-oxoglutarate dehydrogenase complex dihydrolipoamide acyltransferase (E2) component